MASVFLSYSSRDRALAQRIATDLRTAGTKVWFDEWEIEVGDSVPRKIQEGLQSAEFVAVLLTSHSVKSGWVETEWSSKIDAEATGRKVIILPLKGDDCELPPLLQGRRYADFSADYDLALESVLRVLKDSTIGGWSAEDQLAQTTRTDSQLRPPAVRLRILKGMQEGLELRFQKERIIIGRQKGCDLLIGDEVKVSRQHVEIRLEQGRFWLRDLRSKNKTFLLPSAEAAEGEVMELDEKPLLLESGTRFRLGTVLEVQFLLDDAT